MRNKASHHSNKQVEHSLEAAAGIRVWIILIHGSEQENKESKRRNTFSKHLNEFLKSFQFFFGAELEEKRKDFAVCCI